MPAAVFSPDACWRTSHRVDAHLWVGGYLAAACPHHLRERGITHVLKLFADDPSYPGGQVRHPGVCYKVVAAEDRPDYPLHLHFSEGLAFLQEALARGGRVLVHCHAGVSRAPTFAVLYLMARGAPLVQGWRRVKAARPMAAPNPGFRALLLAAEEDRRRRKPPRAWGAR